MVKLARVFAFLVGGLTLVWQGWEVISGRLFNQFLIADIILGIFLIAAAMLPNRFHSALAMLVAYAYSGGVFVVATTGGLLLSKYNFGAFTTTLGLISCSIFVVLLSPLVDSKSLKAYLSFRTIGRTIRRSGEQSLCTSECYLSPFIFTVKRGYF